MTVRRPGRRWGGRGGIGILAALLVVAACQPHARRALLLDLALSDEALVAGTAEPWAAAGYGVDYRRFYPHLTHADLARYGVIVVLGGRTPERWSDAVGLGDLALLTGWVPRGGVLVFGYAGDGEGSLDRWVMNRWLRAMGTGIRIGADLLRDTSQARLDPPGAQPPARVSAGPLGLAGLRAFPSGRNHALDVRRAAQALARAPASAFLQRRDTITAAAHAPVVAASRVGRGLVLVTSRHLLGALGPELRGTPLSAVTRDSVDSAQRFLVALARWTRRPAAWATVPAAEGTAPLTFEQVPSALSARAPARAAPPSADVTRLRTSRQPAASAPAAPPEWIVRHGMRIAWARSALTERDALDALLGFLDAADLNLLVSPAALPSVDSLRLPGATDPLTPAWREALQRLGATSVRWFPSLPLVPPGYVGNVCLLDAALWSDWLDAALRRLTARIPARSDPVAGVAIELPPRDTTPLELCDANLQVALARLGWDDAAIGRVLARSAPERYEALLTSGALGDYVMALEAELGTRAARLARDARRAVPNLIFALWSGEPAADWRAYGLARGFGADGMPVLVWDTEPQTGPGRARQRRGVTILHALALPADALPVLAWNRLRPVVFGGSDGFWIGPVERFLNGPRLSVDSLTRLVRQFTRPP